MCVESEVEYTVNYCEGAWLVMGSLQISHILKNKISRRNEQLDIPNTGWLSDILSSDGPCNISSFINILQLSDFTKHSDKMYDILFAVSCVCQSARLSLSIKYKGLDNMSPPPHPH